MKDLSRTYEEQVEEISVLKQKIEELEQSTKAHMQAERYQQLTAEILGILNNPSVLTDAISLILSAIKRETGFEAVGIRLRSSDDFPYFVQEGFSNDFLLTENTLVVRTKDGWPCKDKDRNYILECTCGLVISGQTDPTNPLFTPGGSAWTNNSLTLLDLSPDQDPRLHPRNRCVHEGFISVALIPIRENQEIIGLLQLNDREKDRFTLNMIHFFEGISASIGVALKRKQEEKALRESEARFRNFADLLPEIVFEIDQQGLLTFWNQNAFKSFGYTQADFAVGLNVLDAVTPDDRGRAWENIQRILKDGYIRSNEYLMLRKDGSVFPSLVFSTPVIRDGESVRLRGFIIDITERKQMEEELRKSHDELEVRVLERTAELAQSNKELTIEIAERLKMEQTLQESKNQLRILASQILSTQEIERKRIALEVHDILGSNLTAIKFKAEEALQHFPKDGTSNISNSLETLIPIIQDTIEEARRIQADLRPPLLDDLGIIATFSWFCRRFETIYSGIKVEQAITIREEDVPDHLKIALFRITQEAMNNIAKYAKTDLVYLELRKVDSTIELSISDKGEGFDLESLSSRTISKKGLGISSMRERIEFSGGSFSIHSVKGKGTVVRAVWPI